ncbi:MAG TPA: hypothetical protein VN853_05260 [Polyangia bacterium]|nr:hypothetical protein [Polyangia bacterium]
MDHDSLVALFRRIILAGPSLLLGAGLNVGCSSGGFGCPLPDKMQTVELSPRYQGSDAGLVDGSVEDLLARCQASSSDCTPLCQQVLWSPGSEPRIHSCELVPVDGGLTVRIAYETFCGGRCPEGLAPPASVAARDALAAWLSASAHMEAASIDAFEILATELDAHRAPPALIQAARAAAADERRHADAIGRLAARRGTVAPEVRVNRGPIRDIEGVARENAVEGCVRETYAALLACRQARAATDPAIRSAMTGIARDETQHAALAWAVDQWSQAMLAPQARRRVREARREAIEGLVNVPLTLSRGDRAQAGLPDEEEEARIGRELGAALV